MAVSIRRVLLLENLGASKALFRTCCASLYGRNEDKQENLEKVTTANNWDDSRKFLLLSIYIVA